MSFLLRHTSRHLRELCLIAFALAVVTGCGGGSRVAPSLTPLSDPALGVSWLAPSERDDQATLARWRAAVGAPVVNRSTRGANDLPLDELTIVSWNIALGAGDVAKLMTQLQEERPGRAVVLLLQEAFRGGPEVPRAPAAAAFAAKIRGASAREIDDVARALDVWLYYVPSMRNGAPGLSDEDRGNAILSTIPLEELTAIELPFERQRRVAVGATVRGRTPAGEAWSLHLASAHLDNMAGANRAWLGGEYARARQARGLRTALAGKSPLVLAGDFNTWFGFGDAGYVETALAFPQTRVSDHRRTFMGLLRLDHVFYRLPSGWRANVRRGESALGSDHFPLITVLSINAVR